MSESPERRFIRIVSGEARGVGAAIARTGLAVLEPGYTAVTSMRNRCYDIGILRQRRISRPVISVGNITTGGTGKTPVVAWLAKYLISRGRRVSILTRGYKSAGGQSDEVMQLRAQLGDKVDIRVGANRHANAAEAIARRVPIDVFLMDDGFQHRALHRDFDLVLVDASNPFGYGRILPRGLLRESPRGLRRADAILLTKADQVKAAAVEQLVRQCSRSTTARVFRCSHELSGFRVGAQRHSIAHLQNKKVFAFAGIGDPRSFQRLLERAGCDVVATRWFPDHHPFSPQEIHQLEAHARACDAQFLITTQKDAMRLPLCESIAVAEMALRFEADDERQLLHAIAARLGFTS